MDQPERSRQTPAVDQLPVISIEGQKNTAFAMSTGKNVRIARTRKRLGCREHVIAGIAELVDACEWNVLVGEESDQAVWRRSA